MAHSDRPSFISGSAPNPVASHYSCTAQRGPWPTSTTLATHPFVPGTEGLEFNSDGTYWTVSGAGTDQYDDYPLGLPGNNTQDHYPLNVLVDPALLTPTSTCQAD